MYEKKWLTRMFGSVIFMFCLTLNGICAQNAMGITINKRNVLFEEIFSCSA